jgi:hypothetical protein
MRFIPAHFLALATSCFVSTAYAQQEVSLQDRIDARRELERAKTDLRYYWQYEYPRRCRALDAAIDITRTEIDNNKELLRDYEPFTRFSTGQPFPMTVRNVQMCIKVGELRLNDLLAERNYLTRFRGDQFRDLSEQVYAARDRVAELDSIAEEAAQPPQEQLPAPLQR